MIYCILFLITSSCIYIYTQRRRANYYALNFRQKRLRKIFNKVYQNLNGERLSKYDRNTVIKDDFSLVYGEIYFDSFATILKKADLKSGEIFYDLGSGTGKAVIAAALLHDFSMCVGLEILPSLYQASLEKLSELQDRNSLRLPVMQFIHTDFFKFDVSKATVVYINATGFFGDSYHELVKLLKKLHPETRIIINTKLLPPADFKLMHQDFYLMSWGVSRVSIYLLKN